MLACSDRIHNRERLQGSVPDVGHPSALRSKRVSPGVGRLLEAASRGELPFGFRGEPFIRPASIRRNRAGALCEQAARWASRRVDRSP